MDRSEGLRLLQELLTANKELFRIEMENRQTYENFMLMMAPVLHHLTPEELALFKEVQSIRHKRASLWLRDVAEMLEDL